jgi:Zn-dependent protease with chaperone function
LRAKFRSMARAAGEAAPPRLEFRAAPAIGPNAFALPAGIIVVTDELIGLAQDDEEVLAVLAHELGHVRHRHTMRHLLQSSATALIIAGVTGDVASATSLAASAPALLVQTKYSRDFEREADRFAIDLLRKAGIGPQHFAAILARLETKRKGKTGVIPTFLSSHPPTEEREALAREAK